MRWVEKRGIGGESFGSADLQKVLAFFFSQEKVLDLQI